MTLQFKPAKKENRQPRICIFGPSGCGKTFDALLIAQALGTPSEQCAVIDTENRRSELYADTFLPWQYCVDALSDYTPNGYRTGIADAVSQGMVTVIVDSLTHLWDSENGLKSVAETTASKNDFGRSWSVAKRSATSVLNDVLTVPANVICTLKAAHVYDHVTDERGRKTRVVVGEKPIFAKEFEYEFDVIFEVDGDHNLTVIKAPLLKGKVVLPAPSVEDLQGFFQRLGTKSVTKPVVEQVHESLLNAKSLDEIEKATAFARANIKLMPKGSGDLIKKWVEEAKSVVK